MPRTNKAVGARSGDNIDRNNEDTTGEIESIRNELLSDSRMEHLPPEALTPYEHNARTHDERQLAALEASIRSFGFVSPVLVDGEGAIIAGHGRVEAARRLAAVAYGRPHFAQLRQRTRLQRRQCGIEVAISVRVSPQASPSIR